MLINPKTCKILHSLVSKQKAAYEQKNYCIRSIKISPNNSMVAFGSYGFSSPLEIMKVMPSL
jgi:hypothetical protein